MIGGMCYMRFRQLLEFRRHPGKWCNACRNHYAPGLRNFSVAKRYLEPGSIFLHAADLAAVEVWDNLLLIPISVSDKILQGDRLRKLRSGVGLEMIQREFVLRVG